MTEERAQRRSGGSNMPGQPSPDPADGGSSTGHRGGEGSTIGRAGQGGATSAGPPGDAVTTPTRTSREKGKHAGGGAAGDGS